MYMLRPFAGRVNPGGEKENGGLYCWFAHANEKYTRNYGGAKISFQSLEKSNEQKIKKFFKEGGKPLIEALSNKAPSHEYRKVA